MNFRDLILYFFKKCSALLHTAQYYVFFRFFWSHFAHHFILLHKKYFYVKLFWNFSKSTQDGKKIHILKLKMQQHMGSQVDQRPLAYILICMQTKPKEHFCPNDQSLSYWNIYFVMYPSQNWLALLAQLCFAIAAKSQKNFLGTLDQILICYWPMGADSQ